MKTDAERARSLMLLQGLSHPRRGIRIAVCDLLGSIHDDEVTEALLHSLENDDFQYVRYQALVSLLAGARNAGPIEILKASATETHEAVLELRRKHFNE